MYSPSSADGHLGAGQERANAGERRRTRIFHGAHWSAGEASSARTEQSSEVWNRAESRSCEEAAEIDDAPAMGKEERRQVKMYGQIAHFSEARRPHRPTKREHLDFAAWLSPDDLANVASTAQAR